MIELKEITMPQVATIPKAAEITHLPKSYIRQLVLSGKVRFIRAGVKYLINLESLAAYLDGGEKGAGNDTVTDG